MVSLEEVRSKASSVSGRVLNANDGEPIATARVGLTDRQTSGGGKKVEVDGSFHQKGLRAGLMVLTIRAAGFQAIHEYVRLIPGKTLDMGTLRLHAATKMRGRIVDEGGSGVVCRVTVRNLDRMKFPQEIDLGWAVKTQTDGTFEVGGLGPGRHLVVAEKRGFGVSAAEVSLGQEDADGIEIALLRGTQVSIKTSVRSSPFFLLQITDNNGNPVVSRFIGGNWTLDFNLAPGNYSLSRFEDIKLISTKKFEVGTTPLTIKAD